LKGETKANLRVLPRFFLIVLVYGWTSTALLAQGDEEEDLYYNPLAQILNKFTFSLSTGYGLSNYNQDLTGFYLLQTADDQYLLSNENGEVPEEVAGTFNWFTNPMLGDTLNLRDPFEIPYAGLNNPVNNPRLQETNLLVDADTAGLGFEATGHSIPLMFTVHYDYQRFRAGLGYMIEYQILRNLNPTVLQDQIRPYVPEFKSILYKRWIAKFGYNFYDWWNYSFVAELMFGGINAGKKFNKELTTRSMFVNIGLNIEKHISEYVSITFRPSYDIKSFNTFIPEAQRTIRTNNPTFFFQVGLSIKWPRLPRSPIKSDHIQLEHIITHPETGQRIEVRGQSIWKWQNPKVGQNHRKLWRYKNKNKRKMYPY